MRASFMDNLIRIMREKGGDALNGSVFEPMLSKENADQMSEVLTSWTVKTEVTNVFQKMIISGNETMLGDH